MRITKETVRRLSAEAERVTGRDMIESINTPGDGRTHYVMAESMTSTYYGARAAAAYLLGVLTGADPDGQIHFVEHRADWITEIDDTFKFGQMTAAQVRAFHAGYAYGKAHRRAITPGKGAMKTVTLQLTARVAGSVADQEVAQQIGDAINPDGWNWDVSFPDVVASEPAAEDAENENET